ncbi:MAG: hypothetical protein KGM44_03750 [bacterium]|nr:hypothetical protein [bacterium]
MSEAVLEPPSAEFVSHEAGRLTCALVVAPDAGFERATPIAGEGPPLAARARAQHAVLVRTLKRQRVDVIEMTAEARFGMATLVRAAGLALPDGVVMARLAEPERRGEEEAVRGLLQERGVRVLGTVEGPGLFDARDAVVMGGRLIVTRSHWTNASAIEQLSAFAKRSSLELCEATLAPGVAHLGDVFSPIDVRAALAVPQLVGGAALEAIEILAVPPELSLAAASLALAPRRVVMDVRAAGARAILKQARVAVEAIDLYDFGRAGAGPSALVLPLRRAALMPPRR